MTEQSTKRKTPPKAIFKPSSIKKQKTDDQRMPSPREVEQQLRDKYAAKENQEVNLIMMSAGDNHKLHIGYTNKDRAQFFKDYIKVLQQGSRLTAKEQLAATRDDKRIKLMVDLDFNFDDPVPEMPELLKTIQDVVATTYSETYNVDDVILERRSPFKWHIIFPNVIDNAHKFKDLSESLISATIDKFGHACDWGKIFDPSVYNNNGLRLPYSYKNKNNDNVRRDEDGKALDPEYYEICSTDDLNVTIGKNRITVEDMLRRSILPTVEELERCPIAMEKAPPKKKEESTKESTDDQPKNKELSPLNKLLKLDNECPWEVVQTGESYQLIPHIRQCLVDPTHTHSGKSHSCMYINKRSVVLNCFSCGERKLPKELAASIIRVFNTTINPLTKDKKRDDYQKLRDDLIEFAHEHMYRRGNDGSVWKPIDNCTYAYERYMEPKPYLNEIFLDSEILSDKPKTIDYLIKYMEDINHSKFPFIKTSRHHLGFRNGVLNIVTCEFTPKDEVEETMCVRKYFDRDLDMNDTETPVFDSLLKFQFPEDGEGGQHEGVYDFKLMSFGRLFFEVGELDNWQFMLYLEGEPGTGRSTLMWILEKFFNEIGTISAKYEGTFGLYSLYDKEVVIIDDLPRDFEKVFPQTDFQSMVSGGQVNIRGIRKNNFSAKWKNQMLMAGNWSLGYLDKGQITRRVLNALWENMVTKVDPTLRDRIYKDELGKLMLKCLRLYKSYRERFGSKGVWDFAPQYFKDTQHVMRTERNPFYRFLCESGKVYFEEGKQVTMMELKRAFDLYMDKTCINKLDKQTLHQVNPKWVCFQPKRCKHCLSPHVKGCCDLYNRNARTTGAEVVLNMVLVK